MCIAEVNLRHDLPIRSKNLFFPGEQPMNTLVHCVRYSGPSVLKREHAELSVIALPSQLLSMFGPGVWCIHSVSQMYNLPRGPVTRSTRESSGEACVRTNLHQVQRRAGVLADP